MKNYNHLITDVLVIGSGGAGMRAAISAHDDGANVMILSKGRLGVSGSTVTACADVSVDSNSITKLLGFNGDIEDSKEQFAADTIKSGWGLNHKGLVDVFVDQAPQRVKELIDWGAKVENIAISPGHTYRRAIIIKGNNFAHTLARQVKLRPDIQVLEGVIALDIIVKDGCATGVYAVNIMNGEFTTISAKSIIIATGGAMNVFPVTTAPNDLMGDGMAMAYRAGAKLVDMEFQTFLMGCCSPPSLVGNNYPFVLMCRAGAHLYNREGERFMEKWDPERREKSTRDKIAVASTLEILEGRGGRSGGVWVSVRHIPKNLFEYYTEWYEGKKTGFDEKDFLPDLMQDGIESMPSAHFWNGGIKIDTDCYTGIEGLFAAGECAGGIHGANRLSGNAMSEILVTGNIAGRSAARTAVSAQVTAPSKEEEYAYYKKLEDMFCGNGSEDPVALKKQLQKTAWETIGPVREQKELERAIRVCDEVENKIPHLCCHEGRVYNKEWIDAMSLANMCDIIRITAAAAAHRKESRSSHYRKDYNKSDDSMFCNIIAEKSNGQLKISNCSVSTRKVQGVQQI
jgi:succinate dehydrogenase/fumarate reductase flavoprotein subunit